MQKVESEPAFVLHWRDYTDSRVIIDFFTRHYGKVSAVYRVSSRKAKGGAKPQQFTTAMINFHGKNELKTLTHIEQEHAALLSSGNALYCGLYLNELLLRLLAPEDTHTRMFDAYQHCLNNLASLNDGCEDIALREFEFILLDELGYGVDLSSDTLGNEILGATPEGGSYYYLFDPNSGFTPVVPQAKQIVFRGDDIRNIGQKQWQAEGARQAAKKLCRLALKDRLGGKPLMSRELFK